jgi:hypothetical protein
MTASVKHILLSIKEPTSKEREEYEEQKKCKANKVKDSLSLHIQTIARTRPA